MSLSGFTAADLDVYEPSKWRSNVWNKGRLEVRGNIGYQGVIELIYRAGAVSSTSTTLAT